MPWYLVDMIIDQQMYQALLSMNDKTADVAVTDMPTIYQLISDISSMHTQDEEPLFTERQAAAYADQWDSAETPEKQTGVIREMLTDLMTARYRRQARIEMDLYPLAQYFVQKAEPDLPEDKVIERANTVPASIVRGSSTFPAELVLDSLTARFGIHVPRYQGTSARYDLMHALQAYNETSEGIAEAEREFAASTSKLQSVQPIISFIDFTHAKLPEEVVSAWVEVESRMEAILAPYAKNPGSLPRQSLIASDDSVRLGTLLAHSNSSGDVTYIPLANGVTAEHGSYVVNEHIVEYWIFPALYTEGAEPTVIDMGVVFIDGRKSTYADYIALFGSPPVLQAWDPFGVELTRVAGALERAADSITRLSAPVVSMTTLEIEKLSSRIQSRLCGREGAGWLIPQVFAADSVSSTEASSCSANVARVASYIEAALRPPAATILRQIHSGVISNVVPVTKYLAIPGQ